MHYNSQVVANAGHKEEEGWTDPVRTRMILHPKRLSVKRRLAETGTNGEKD